MSVMNVRRLIPSTALAGAVALGLVSLSACAGSSDAADGGNGGKLDVVASFYPMQYLAEQIGGGHVAVDTLTKPGVEPHDLELKPRQIGELGEADVVLYLKGIQPAVDKAIAQAGCREHRRRRHPHEARGPRHRSRSRRPRGPRRRVRRGARRARRLRRGPRPRLRRPAADPHVWLDPVKYAEVAKGVGSALAKADPANAADYKKNTDALVKKLGDLDTAFETGLKNTATKTFITTHSAFGYLAERYGLDQEGISGVDPESEPSPARIKELQDIAEKDKVTTVFFETLASDRTAKTLASDTGLRTDVLDPLEGITDTSKGDDYIEVMRSNLAALQKALGAK